MIYLENLWDLFVDMSFYIVIGLVFTGLLHAFIKKDTILKHVGKDNTASVVKASVIGVPLPLCSCGVVPTAMYLGKSGASKGSVVSFLTSTPQTGVDSIIATYGMLGPVFAVYRALAAFLSGIISGVVTNIFCKNDNIDFDKSKTSCGCSEAEEDVGKVSCCSSGAKEDVEKVSCCSSGAEDSCATAGAESCCSSQVAEDAVEKLSFAKKLKLAFTYGFGEFLDEIAVHFVVGLLIAALISTLLPASIFESFSNPLLTMVLMVLIGIPMYICSTASIPIAVSLMIKGISPGAAFVFLFAGPVTNIASLLVLSKTLGKKVTAIYLTVAAICAIAFGMLFDYGINAMRLSSIFNVENYHTHAHEEPIYMTVVAVLFGALVLWSLIKRVLSMRKHSGSCGCSSTCTDSGNCG